MAVISYKCPNCDGELVFEPSAQNYKCEYCLSSFSQEELESMKPDMEKEQKAEAQPQSEAESEAAERARTGGAEKAYSGEAESERSGEAVIYVCPSCGAQIVTDSTTAATFCYYCHNPVVLSGRLSGELEPDHVIPFAIDKKQAEQRFLDFVHSKKFVPRAFFQKKQIEKLSGVYFPYWVYDCTMEGSMDAQGTNIRVWRNGDVEYTETKYYEVEREGTLELSNLTRNALTKANRELVEGVLPYDLTQAKKFHMGFLSGFLAEKRDVESESLKQQTEQEVKEYGRQLLRDTISGYSGVTVNSHQEKLLTEKWSYVLLPVWTLTYKGKNGKLYYYSLNGQTGKVYGELPVDYKRVSGLAGIVALIVLVLFLIGGYLI